MFTLAAALAAAPRSQAGLAQLVPSDAQFACYIDLQAVLDFVGRDLVQAAIHQQAGQHAPVRLRRDWNERMAKEWGIDPLRDLQGVLLFGDELDGEDPAIVLLTSDRIDGLLDKLSEMGALDRQQRDGVDVLRVSPDKVLSAFGIEEEMDGEAFLHVQKLRGQGAQRAITFGQSLAALMPKVRALGGRGDREPALAMTPRKGCIAYLEVADALRHMLGETPASKMASKTKHLSMQLSDADGEIEFTAALQTANKSDARQIAALVNGLKALASMVELDEEVPEEVMQALSDAHADADGNQVTLQFKLGRAILDQARQMIRDGMRDGDVRATQNNAEKHAQKHNDADDDDDEQPRRRKTEEPKPGARSKRSIR